MNLIPIIGNLLYETLSAMVLRVAWKTVIERFITRFTVWGLRSLAKGTENKLDDKTVEDILSSLKNKKLKVIDELKGG